VIGDERAESARRVISNMEITGYAKTIKIRYLWCVAPCHKSEYQTKNRSELAATFNLNKRNLATFALSCIQTSPPTGGFFYVRILRSANSFLRTADSETNNIIVFNMLYPTLRI